VRDLPLPQECILVSVRRGGRAIIPRGDTTLETGDRIVALARPDSAMALREGLAEAIV
jgi:CIC family chloride channel protein